MAATEVLAVAEQMAAGPVEMASLLRHQYSQRKLKEKKTSTQLLPPSPFTRPTRWDVTGVCVKQNWKGAQMAFSGGAYTAAGKCSQVVDWYQWHQNVHRSRHSSFPLAPAQLHARLAAQPPASILYVRFTVVSRDLTVCCVSVCVCLMYPSQTRQWSCGKSVRETSVRRATTWRMRTDGSETRRPSHRYWWEVTQHQQV